MTTADPGPDTPMAREPMAREEDEEPTDSEQSEHSLHEERAPSPTPHPGEPDIRRTSAVRGPDDDAIEEGISAPRIGP